MDSLTIARVVLSICKIQAKTQLEIGTVNSIAVTAQEIRLTAQQIDDAAYEMDVLDVKSHLHGIRNDMIKLAEQLEKELERHAQEYE